MRDWEQGRVPVNGVTLRYFRSGGDFPQLVLVHGFTDNALYYSRLAELLAGSWDVVAYDCRGHGASSRAGGKFDHADRVADLVGFVDALGLTRPVLVGHSMGAATIARACGENPELSRGIVLEDPAWWEPPPGLTPEQSAEMERGRRERNAAWRDSIVSLQAGTWEQALAWRRSDSPLWSERDIELSAASRFEVEIDLFAYFPSVRSDFREFVRRAACPALLVCGENVRGAIITPDQAAEVTALNALFRSVVVEGAGHAVRYDQFSRFCDAVLPFVDSLRDGA